MVVFKKYTIRFITLVVALQLLNLSIYAQDFKPIYDEAGSDETNITETITEFIVENILGHTNAIPEQTQHHKDLHFHKHAAFKAIKATPGFPMPEMQRNMLAKAAPLQDTYKYLYLQEINPPPPKA